MQDPAGHRNNILSARMTEVGMGVLEAPDWVMTQDFATRWDYEARLVGVVIDDADGDRFYDMGEGLGGVTVTATSLDDSENSVYSTVIWSPGGIRWCCPKAATR